MTALAEALTVSVISHGHGALLTRLLDDLSELRSLRGVQIIVTLNKNFESVDPFRYPNLRLNVIRNERPIGFGANHNHAFALTTTPWFVILNPDLRITEDVFTSLIILAEQNPAVAISVPRVVNSLGKREDSLRHNLTPLSLIKRVLWRDKHPAANDGRFCWHAGMFYLIRHNAFASIGGFDERYFLYCEDYDLCARLHLARWQFIERPELTIVHDAQRDSHRSGRHLRLHLASLIRVWLSAPVWRIALEDALTSKKKPTW